MTIDSLIYKKRSALGDSKRSILVVDDDEGICALIYSVLVKDFAVRTATSIPLALKMAREEVPDLFLVDLNVDLRANDGVDFIRALMDEAPFRACPVMFLSGTNNSDVRAALINEFEDADFLNKPIHPAELRARVRNLVKMKIVRELLQAELRTRDRDVVALAQQVRAANQAARTSLDEATLMRKLAETSLRQRANFMRVMAHELRTPVAALMIQMQLFERKASPAGLVRMRRSIDRLLDLVESIVHALRVSDHRTTLDPEEFHLAVLVSEVVQRFAPFAEQTNCTIAWNVERGTDPNSVFQDRRMLQLVLSHLLENAIRVASEGTVTVRVYTENSMRVIEVKDTGPTLSAAEREHIFDPFGESDTRFSVGSGSGFGLSLARDIARALGGDIACIPGSREETTMRLTIPERAPDRALEPIRLPNVSPLPEFAPSALEA